MGYSNNVVYDNEVLENRIADILETGLDSMSFMTVDRDLQQNAGMKKVIHTYTYEGAVEAVAEGQATKIIIPSEMQNLAGTVTAINELIDKK